MCNNIYIARSELIKIRHSFPQRILRRNFSLKLKMDFKLSTSLKCFAVSGFHPPPVKQDADALPLNSTLHSPLSPALQALSLGSDTHPKADTERSPQGAVWWQEGHHKPKAAVSQSLIRDSEGTVPATSLLCAGPLSTSSGGTLERLCWCLRGAWGTADHRVRLHCSPQVQVSPHRQLLGERCPSVKSLPRS